MAVDFERLISSPTAAYAEGLRFFSGTGMLNDTLKRLAADLDRNDIAYAVIGAIALNQHGYQRFTHDIDVLLTSDGLETFRDKLVGLGYRPAFEGATRRYRTTAENVPVEVIVAGEYPGDGKPKPVSFPDPAESAVMLDGISTLSLEKLIELKLASGITAGDRLKDLADVQELIKLKGLDDTFANTLSEFVRPKFLELWRSVAEAAAQRTKDELN